MAGCASLTAGLDPSCDALEKPGGLDQRFWVGERANITAYTVDGTTGDISGITMASSTYLYSFIGRHLKHKTGHSINVGTNFNSFKQMMNAVLYYFTQAERDAIEDLVAAKDLVIFTQNTAGQIEVWGLDTKGGSTSYVVGGMNVESGEQDGGVELQDDTSFKIALSGNMRNMAKVFNEGTAPFTLADNIAYLDALLAP